jgi:hypothetical protein
MLRAEALVPIRYWNSTTRAVRRPLLNLDLTRRNPSFYIISQDDNALRDERNRPEPSYSISKNIT